MKFQPQRRLLATSPVQSLPNLLRQRDSEFNAFGARPRLAIVWAMAAATVVVVDKKIHRTTTSEISSGKGLLTWELKGKTPDSGKADPARRGSLLES